MIKYAKYSNVLQLTDSTDFYLHVTTDFIYVSNVLSCLFLIWKTLLWIMWLVCYL